MNIVIKNARYVLTPIHKHGLNVYEYGDIVIEDGLIKCIGRNCGIEKPDYVINADKHIVYPCYIDSHTHIGYPIYYVLLNNMFSQEFYKRTWEIDREIVNKQYVRSISRLTCISMLLNGVIGFINMYHYPEETINTCKELYIMTGPGPGLKTSIDIGSFMKKYSGEKRVFLSINIPSLQEIGLDELVEINNIATEHNMWKTIQVSATRNEVFYTKKKYNVWPIEYLYNNNILDQRTILAHLNWLSSMEIGFIREKKTYVAITPSSTMYLGERGYTPLYELLRQNISVTIGSDGFPGLWNGYNRYLYDALQLYRYSYGDNRVRMEELYPYVLLNSYELFGLKGGVIDKGFHSYIVVVSLNNIIGNIILDKTTLVYSLFTKVYEPEYVVVKDKIVVTPENKERYLDEASREASFLKKYIYDKILPRIHGRPR